MYATQVPVDATGSKINADHLLPKVAKAWFAVAFAGQLLFVIYILGHYGGLLLNGGMEAWVAASDNSYRAGDWLGNLAMAAHVFLAAYIMISAQFQLLPGARRRWPRLHRINGRTYVACVVTTSLAGLLIVWTRGTVGGEVMRIGISLDAVLIIAFAWCAVAAARRGDFNRHQRWVLRLFMAVSAVWFFRITFMLWMVLTGGVGVDFETFTGPFPYTLVFAQYLVPLLLLEYYFWAKASRSVWVKSCAVGVFVLCSLLTFAGVGAATAFMWLPKLV